MKRSVRGVAALLGISFSMLGGSVAAQEKTALVTERLQRDGETQVMQACAPLYAIVAEALQATPSQDSLDTMQRHLQTALGQARVMDDPHAETFAHWWRSKPLTTLGRYDDALTALDAADAALNRFEADALIEPGLRGPLEESDFAQLRRAMLESEGVGFLPDGRVDMDQCRWIL